MERAKMLHGKRRPYRPVDLARFMYDTTMSPKEAIKKWRGEEEEDEEEDIEQDDDTFFKRTGNGERDDLAEDRTIPRFNYEELSARWSNQDAVEALRSRFATANLLDGEDEGEDGGDDDEDGFGDEDEDDEGDGAFEDLEAEEDDGADEDEDEEKSEEEPEASLEAEREKNARRKEELKLRFEEEDREGFTNDKAIARREGGGDNEFGEDDWYDAQKAMLQKQLDINKSEFEELDETQRTAVEGYRAGKYAKIVIEGVPAEFVNRFQARLPIIVGGLSPTEDRFGFVQVRIKRHRWHKKIRKFIRRQHFLEQNTNSRQ
jgi:ribosome biogenesis protein BMS1